MPGPDSPPDKAPVGSVPVLRVFLSSPGDVAPERQAALVVLRRLQARYRGAVLLVPVLWEHEPLLASAGFQEGIADRLPPSASDIAVFVLWSRLGTPLSSNFTLPDGRRPTGTEWEFEEAMQSRKTQDTPDILVYRKTEAPKAALVEGRDSVSERIRQYESVGAFFERHFKDAADLTFRGAFHNFADAAELASLLDIHLTALLEDRFRGREGARAVVWHESPFRGLQTFEARHWPIYFGRTRAQDDVLLALGRQVVAGRAFVLVVGVSGSGKSSLLRAGVLPFLDHPGAVEPQLADAGGCCRHAIVRPADGATPTEALCAALVAEGALPELRRAGSPTELARVFSESPAAAVAHIRAELSRLAATGRSGAGRESPRPARLVLLVDQLEEIFTREGVTNGDRESFVAVLDAMARSGLVWVLVTLRSDFYPGLTSLPALLALKDGDGQYDLPAVEGEDWTRIVRLPAQAAGLEYERDPSGTGDVADRLIAEASRIGRDALPLLQFALQELYERRDQRPGRPARLGWKAHSDLGGLSGAVRARADAEWERLSQEARAAFPHVLRSLVEASSGQDAVATRRRAPLAELAAQVGAKEIVERFVAARLLVVEGDGGGAVVSVAHEALLRTWPRASEQLAREASLLRLRTWLRTRTAEWERRGRRSGLLTSADELADGRALRASGFTLTPAEDNLLAASDSRSRRARAARWAAVVSIALLAVASMILATVLGQERNAADKARADAVASALTAEGKSRIARAQVLAFKAAEAGPEHPQRSLLLASEAVRTTLDVDGFVVPEAHSQLRAAIGRSDGFLLVPQGTPANVLELSPAEDLIAIGTGGGDLYIRQLEGIADGEPPRILGHHGGGLKHAKFSADGNSLISLGADSTIRLWQRKGGGDFEEVDSHSAEWGGPIAFVGQGTKFVFPDAAGKWSVARYAKRSLSDLQSLDMDGDPVKELAAARTTNRFLTRHGEAVRFWDLDAPAPGIPVLMFRTPSRRVVLSDDGTAALVVDNRGGIHVWGWALASVPSAVEQNRITSLGEVTVAEALIDGVAWMVQSDSNVSMTVVRMKDGSVSVQGPVEVSGLGDWRPTGRGSVYLRPRAASFAQLGKAPALGHIELEAGKSAVRGLAVGLPSQITRIDDDGKWLVYADGEAVVRVASVRGASVERAYCGHEGRVTQLVVSGKRGWAVSTATDGTTRAWRLPGYGDTIGPWRYVEDVQDHSRTEWIQSSPRGRWLAGRRSVWRVLDDGRLRRVEWPTAEIGTLSFSHDERWALSRNFSSEQSSGLYWLGGAGEPQIGAEVRVGAINNGWMYSGHGGFTKGDDLLAVPSVAGTVEVLRLDVRAGLARRLCVVDVPKNSYAYSLFWFGNDDLIASSKNASYVIRNLRGGQPVVSAVRAPSNASPVWYSPAREGAPFGRSGDGAVWKLEMADLDRIQLREWAPPGSAWSHAVSASQAWTMFGNNHSVRLCSDSAGEWAHATVSLENRLVPDGQAFAADDSWFAVFSEVEHGVEIRSLQAPFPPVLLATLKGYTSRPGLVRCSLDSRWLLVDASGSGYDLWDLHAPPDFLGAVRLSVETGLVSGADMIDGGRFLALRRPDGSISTMPISFDDLLSRAAILCGRNLSAPEWATYMGGAEPRPTFASLPEAVGRDPDSASEIVVASEIATVATLRNIISAQAQFQQLGGADSDHDQVGEYGGLAELSGGAVGRTATALTQPLLAPAFRTLSGRGVVVRGDYCFRVYLPDANGLGVGEPRAGFNSSSPVNSDLAETTWCCYAWPVDHRTGSLRAFCVNQGGDILWTEDAAYVGSDGGPLPSAAFLGTQITGALAIDAYGSDGSLWRLVR